MVIMRLILRFLSLDQGSTFLFFYALVRRSITVNHALQATNRILYQIKFYRSVYIKSKF